MSKATPLQHWSWVACDAVNKMVTCDAPAEDIHVAINRVRDFFEERASQTVPLPAADNFSDLLGVD